MIVDKAPGDSNDIVLVALVQSIERGSGVAGIAIVADCDEVVVAQSIEWTTHTRNLA